MITSILERERFREWPEDMHEYWQRHAEALWVLFEFPSAESWDGDVVGFGVVNLLEHTAHALQHPSSPLAGLLEAPPEITKHLSDFVEHFEALEEARQEWGRLWMRRLLEVLSPESCTHRLPIAALAEQGVAPRPPLDQLALDMEEWGG